VSDGLYGLYQLKKGDVKRAAEVLGRAFYNEPLALSAYREEERDRDGLLYFYQSGVRYGLRYGECYASSPEIEGIALWVTSNKYPVTFWRTLRSSSPWIMFNMMRRIGIKRLKSMEHIGKHQDEAHKQLAPFEHYFLMVLGVDPEHQGKGHASELLKPMFARLDEKRIPCYTDTLTEKNAQMYEHLGFHVLEKSDISDTDFTSWALLREPR